MVLFSLALATIGFVQFVGTKMSAGWVLITGLSLKTGEFLEAIIPIHFTDNVIAISHLIDSDIRGGPKRDQTESQTTWDSSALLGATGMAAGVAVAPIAAPPVLGAVGFGAAGPVAGSIAAGIQASMGNVVAGSFFAGAQSVAMGGALPAIGSAISGGILGAVATVVGLFV
ncbi:hypothetical protein ONZ45_g1519 [Pleurotus djamor]|nr:hypothetical protein ONZ45_g1519 [Pleurotus djamor]